MHILFYFIFYIILIAILFFIKPVVKFYKKTDFLYTALGDDISKRKLDNFLSNVESELGKTVSYTLMETDEFKYRMGMFDRFLRDIFEYPHEKLLNKLNLAR